MTENECKRRENSTPETETSGRKQQRSGRTDKKEGQRQRPTLIRMVTADERSSELKSGSQSENSCLYYSSVQASARDALLYYSTRDGIMTQQRMRVS